MAERTVEPADAAHSMTCMEIWGGNRATRRAITLPGLDAWIYSVPYQQAESGGDVYYVSNCATGRITRLMLADVSGHGSAVAETANNLRLLMRRYVNHIQQVKFVSSMNDEFSNVSHEGRFATAVVATFLAPTRRLTFSNAGHPCPLIYTVRDQRWRLLETLVDDHGRLHGPSDLPLGIFQNGTYAELELELDVGDLVLFYTDALIESRGRDGEMLGSHAFLNVVRTMDSGPPETLLERIVAQVTALHPGNLTDDDVTLLLFRATGEAAQVPLRNRVMAPFRLLKGVAISLLNGGRGIPLPEISWENLGIGSVDASLGRRARQ